MSASRISQDEASLRQKIVEIFSIAGAIGSAFLILNWIHFQYFIVSVILYACTIDAAISTVLVLIAYRAFWWHRSSLLPTETILTVIAANLLVMLYAVMGPTVIDRSLSIYIVQKVDMRGGEIAEAAMSDIFVQEYMPEFRLVDVRLTEQTSSGTMIIDNGCIKITEHGRRLSRFANFYRKNFLPKRRLLLGEVTDQLTDPFRDSLQIVDTDCTEK